MKPQTLPQVVVSRDGRRAVKLVEFAENLTTPTGFDGYLSDSIVQLRPRGPQFAFEFRISDSFRTMWNIKGQQLKWPSDFASALPDLALIALGRFLDDNLVPDDPADGEYAARVPVTTDLFEIFKQQPADESRLSHYVRGRVFWGWKFKAEPTRFRLWEARRFRVDIADFEQAAFPLVGSLWARDASGAYTALPALAAQGEHFGNAAIAGASVSAAESYDVALSFAGEQRSYVHDVAAALKKAGVSVFYDGFEDLWGKDLTKELEEVYRRGSRFVVVFVSRDYVAKAWPNLERQHALAGRIERMDDSVLPARFDSTELPGLPATVGYRDISAVPPHDLAAIIVAKVRGSGGSPPSND